MALILAVDPERRQQVGLECIGRELDGHELLSAASTAEALAAIDRRVPDLVLLPLLLPESEERELLARVRARSSGGEVHALTIPILKRAGAAPPAQPRWSVRFGTPAARDASEGCDPGVFAELIRKYLRPPVDVSPDEDPAPAVQTLQASPALPDRHNAVIAAAHVAASWARARSAAWDGLPLESHDVPGKRDDDDAGAQDLPADLQDLLADAQDLVAQPPPLSTLVKPAPVTPREDDWAVTSFDRAEAVPAMAPQLETAPPPELEISPSAPCAIEKAHKAGRKPVERRGPSAVARVAALARSFGVSLLRAVPYVATVAVVLTAGAAGRAYWIKLQSRPKTGTAVLESNPSGSQVLVDGNDVGVTPVTATLPAGSHAVEFRTRNDARTVRVVVAAGGRIVESVDWTRKPTGRLDVISNPPGARVLVDGTDRGVTPATLDDLAAGVHAVVLESGGGSIRRSVTIKADDTAKIDETIFAGFLKVFSPFDLRITDGTAAIRLDDRNQVMLPPGPHDLRLENRALGYQDVRRIEIRPGETSSLSIIPPRSKLSVSASTPAEVWVDGVRAGETPLFDVPVDLGTREVLLKSAAGDERRIMVTITVKPVDLNVDFSRPVP